nr:hypothetical protein L204_06422 [Cryptococcus depauperatus CBS 7855]
MTEGNPTNIENSSQEEDYLTLLELSSQQQFNKWLNDPNDPNILVLKTTGYEILSRPVASGFASVDSGHDGGMESALKGTRGALTSVANEASHICSRAGDGLSNFYRGQSPGLSSNQSRLSYEQSKPRRKKQPEGSHNITVKNLSIAAVALLGLTWGPKALQGRHQDRRMFG